MLISLSQSHFPQSCIYFYLVNMPKGRGMIKWTPFAAMPEQFAGIREIIKEKTKVERPTLTQDEQELIENMLYVRFFPKRRY